MHTDRTFVSYSRSDSEFAVKLASDLRAKGAEIWLDQLDIEAGARWDSAIEQALQRSARVLVVLSPQSVASQNVLDEVSFALEEGKTVVPVLVEACAIPMRLRRVQYVDFTRDYDAALGRLLGTLGVAPSAAASPPKEPRAERPATAPAAPPPSPEPLTDTNATSVGGPSRALLLGAGAAALVVLAVVVSLSMGGDPEIGPADSSATTATAPDTRAAEAPPPQAAPAAAAATVNAPADPPAGGSGIGRLFSAGTPLTFPSGGDTEAGLKVLLGVTRQMERRDTLTQADLEELAEAQSLACRGQSSTSACESTASDYVESALRTVCSRMAGARPAETIAAGRHDAQVLTCQQSYLNVLLTQLDLKAQEAIRKIKAG